jgi:hypothetical protein
MKKRCNDPECKLAHPELGQAAFGNPVGTYDLPEFAQALFFHIWSEIARVFGNKNQRDFCGSYGEDPGIAGINVRPYYWGDDAAEAELPNFRFEAVEIRWYKYPGRGMSCNVDWTAEQWVTWFNACMTKVRGVETGY